MSTLERHWRTAPMSCVALLVCAAWAYAQDAGTSLVPAGGPAPEPTEAAAGVQGPELSQMSLEDLMRIQIQPVFGASKHDQPETEAPSSVTIITADDIARFGYRTLADILRGVRGLYVTDDRNYSYVGVRGFDRPGDYNSRVLVLIDGHRVNDDVFDQAPIGAELGIDPSTFERVEVIRGPSSALYGTSAFFAVINITTKRASDMQGASLWGDGGSLGTASAIGSIGHTFANGVAASVAGNVSDSAGNGALYYPEFDTPETNNGVAVNADAEYVRGAIGHVTTGNLTLTGAYGWRQKYVPTASFGTLFNDPQLETVDERAWADAQYQRPWHGATVDVHTYLDWYEYNGVYPYASITGIGPITIFQDYGHGVWWGTEGRATRRIPGHQTLTVGSEYRDNVTQDQGAEYSDDRQPAWTTHVGSQVFAVYAQDELRIRNHLLLSGGGRYDAYEGFNQFSPRGSVVFMPTVRTSFKYLFGSAFRAPNAYEFDYTTNGVRNTALKPESINSHELVWEHYAERALRMSVSGYWNNTKDLITLDEDGGPDLLSYVNIGRVRAEGTEIEAEIKLPRGMDVLTSYSLGNAYDRDTGLTLTNSPHQLLKGRVSASGPFTGSTIALEVLGMSSRTTLAGGSVGSNVLTNVTYLQTLGTRFRLNATVRNAFNVQYADPASDEHIQDSIPQDGRTVRVGLQYTFANK